MGGEVAFKLAIDLFHFPAQARSLRDAPLADGISNLIRAAAGDEQAVTEACDVTGRSSALVREAAAFYVEQILLHPEADSYRVLGAKPDATYGELRRNMAHLLRWIHPDSDSRGERMVFASRVTAAWDNLKTKERRAHYDRSIARLEPKTSHRHQRRGTPRNEKRYDQLRPRSMARSKFAVERRSPRASNRTDLHQYMGPFRRVFLFLFGRILR